MRFLILFLLAWIPGVSNAEDWSQFRGPSGCGVTTRGNLPLEWSAKTGKNIRWSVDAEGQGTSSPIVWKDRVYIANVTANPDGEQPLHHGPVLPTQRWQTTLEDRGGAGRYVDYPGYGHKGHRTTANMYLTLLHLAGAKRDTFGMPDPNLKGIDQTGPLSELLA